ncbi:MAG: TonB-dependent receptor [Verrucomicrobia bacterium]|nr:TonB-dependent receptor [Verrucomicrobiota bacterium]
MKTLLMFRVQSVMSLAVVIALLPASTMAQPGPTVPPGAATEETLKLSPFEVNSTTGYNATMTSSGTRIRADIRELPFSVGIVTSDFINDFAAFNDYKDSFAYTSGVSSRGNYNQAYYVRGLQNDGQLRNGFFRAGMFDAANVDRIEVIKGPNAGIYGRASPGGAINVVTKMPTPFLNSSATVRYGDNQFRRYELAASGPIVAKKLLFRIDTAHQTERFFYDNEDFRQDTVSGVLQYLFDAGGKLTFEADWLDKPMSANGANTLFRRVGGVTTSQLAEELGRFNPAPPETGLNRQLKAGNLTFEQKLTDRIQFRATAHSSVRLDPSLRVGGDQFYTVETRTVANRLADLQEGGTRYVAAQSDLLIDFDTGPVQQKLLATFDFARDTSRDERWRVLAADRNNPLYNVPTLNVSAPNYFVVSDKSLLRDFYRNDTSRSDTSAVFVSDRVYFAGKRGLLLLGGRQNWVKSTSLDYRSGATTDQRRKALTYQLGLNWKINEPLSVYANYSTSFRVNGGLDPTGKPWDNQKGKGGEGGFKAELLNQKLTLTMAYFDITRFNVIRTNAVTRLQELTGAENSKGWEFDFQYQVTKSLLLFGQYTNLKARFVADLQDPTLVGFQIPFVPDESYGIAVRYELRDGRLKGLFSTLGWKSVGAITTSTTAGYQRNYVQAAYTQLDGSVGYTWKSDGTRLSHKVAINLKNLLDEHYYFGDRTRGLGFASYFAYTLSYR